MKNTLYSAIKSLVNNDLQSFLGFTFNLLLNFFILLYWDMLCHVPNKGLLVCNITYTKKGNFAFLYHFC